MLRTRKTNSTAPRFALCPATGKEPRGRACRSLLGESVEYGAGVGLDVAVPAGGRGVECLFGHDASAGVIAVLVAVGEQRRRCRVGVCDEQRRSDAFVE